MKNIDNFQLRPLIGGSPFKKASHRLNKSIKNSELRTLKELKELKGKDKFEQKTKAYLQDKIKTTARSDFSEIQTKLFEALKDGKTDETQLFTNIKEWGTEVYSDYVEGIKKESKANVLNRQKLGIVRSYIDNLKETLKEIKGDKPTYDRENTKKFWASIPKNIAGELKAAILKDVDKTGGAFRFDKKDTGLPYTIIKTNSDPPKYFELINTISEEDKGSTPKEYEDNKVVLGEGAFGKVRLARELNIQNGSVGEFCAVKKLKSSTEHQKEVDSYKTVPDSDGFLKLDGEASIPEDESRQYKGYIFQPILDIDLDEVMMKINNDPRNQQIKNEFERYCAYSFLKSAQTMQENSVAHRDLKLSNMMLNSDGDVFIVDYGTVNQSKDGDITQSVAGTPGVNISFEAMEVMDSLPDDLPEEISKLDINDIIKNEETLQRFIDKDLPKVKKEKPLSYKSLLYFLHATIANNKAKNELFRSQVKTIIKKYNEFEIPEEYKFSEIDSEKYAIGLTALSLLGMNLNNIMEITTKEQIEKLEKSPLLKSLEKLSKKNPKLRSEFIKKQNVSNQKVISKEFKKQMEYYFDSINKRTNVTGEVQIELNRKLRDDDTLKQIIRLLHPNPSERPKIIELNEDEIFGMTPKKPTKEVIERLITP